MKDKSIIDPVIQAINDLRIGDYSTPLSCGKIIFDTAIVDDIYSLANTCDAKDITDVVLIGIGGSHFGVQAVYDALYSSNYRNAPVTLHALTSVYASDIPDMIAWYSALLQDNKKKVFTFIVSKTGTTFETASHSALCVDILKKIYGAHYIQHLCVITDEDSLLARSCHHEKIPTLSIPKKIGGRYSIFSAAGLAVLHFLKIDIKDFLAGAQSVKLTDPLSTASELFDLYKKGFLTHDTFIFLSGYAALGGWLRQLIGESLGKQGKGFLPTVSIGSQDLHSVVQYYFAGALPMVTTFLVPAHYNDEIHIPHNIFSATAYFKPTLSYNNLQDAIIKGLCDSYAAAQKPFFVCTFRKGSAFDIGAFMHYKMLETLYIATLMDIDPFDQPQVEIYKKETRRRLDA